jgi:hypothetical protein
MGDVPRDDDVVELGGRESGRRLRLPGGWRPPSDWRPSRGATAFALAALAVGLAAGYAAGYRHVRGSAALPEPTAATSAAPAPATAFSFADSPALIQDTGACSVQTGQQLELGVQVTNLSTAPITLETAKAVLPMGGLKPVRWQWEPCGLLPSSGPSPALQVLGPGASTWLTMTFDVQLRCPAPNPVEFTVSYLAQGRPATASLPGFPDLGEVPYTGCPRVSAIAVSGPFVTATPDRGINASR